MAQRYEFSDLVADEVRRVLAEQAASAPGRRGGDSGSFLDGLSLTDITKFISEVVKLRSMMGELRGSFGVQPGGSDGEPLLSAPAPAVSAPLASAPGLNPAMIYQSVLSAIEQLIKVAGDMPLSEVRTYMIENKGDVIKMIGEAIK